MKKSLGAIAAAAAIAMSLSLTACATTPGATDGEINYWLWDSNQLPAYKQCAADFTKANPDIKVKITQRGWGDYWTTLSNGFVAGNAPDVFVNHLSKYPEFAANNQLLPLDDATMPRSFCACTSTNVSFAVECIASSYAAIAAEIADPALPRRRTTRATAANATRTSPATMTTIAAMPSCGTRASGGRCTTRAWRVRRGRA